MTLAFALREDTFLPQGLNTPPLTITSPAAWRGCDLVKTPEKWRYDLSAADIAELERAAKAYLALGRDVGEITADAFPLTAFASHLRNLRHQLINGVGVEVITGLPIERYDRETIAAIFCGIGAHLGPARSQNAAGHILGHVRDTGADPTDGNTRIYQTSARQTFHTDSADCVGLICLKDAKEGGDSLLVSAEAIYNRMATEAPELLPRLFDPIATDRRGEVPAGMKPYMEIPPFSWHAGKLTVFYQRQYIDSAQRFPEAMRLTDDHVAALDMFDAIANDPDMHVRMRLAPGDMQFVYNHAHLHDRTGFVDWNKAEGRRHLLRLWLSLPDDRELPPVFAERYGDLTVGDRGGIVVEGMRLCAPLD
ncbi:MAG: TauD/TfdA family dioxygenase [Pikeienuella sp.]